ncbi:MAG: hypothetical protein ACKVWR_14585 [Acidimicrobiales bacterium]
MRDVVLWLAATSGAGCAAVAGGAGACWWALRRRNRVDPKVRVDAPLRWLGAPTRPARLHRRLRRVVALVAAAPIGGGYAADLAGELRREAVQADRELVDAASAGPAERRRSVLALSRRVERLEGAAWRLVRLHAPHRPGGADPARLERIEERLAIAEAAWLEAAEAAGRQPTSPAHADRPIGRREPARVGRRTR